MRLWVNPGEKEVDPPLGLHKQIPMTDRFSITFPNLNPLKASVIRFRRFSVGDCNLLA